MNNNFTRITTLTEQLQNELLGVLATNTEIEAREKLLEDKERDLGVRMRNLHENEKKLSLKEDEYAKNKAYLDRENIRLTKLGHQLEYEKHQAADVDDKLLELEAKKAELTKHEIALGEKIKSLESLTQKEQQLEAREAKITREIAIDRERKRLLDLRVQRIQQRETQLQLDSEKTDF